MFTVHDERCSKTGKHAPLQAGRGVGDGTGRDGTGWDRTTTGAGAGRVAGSDG